MLAYLAQRQQNFTEELIEAQTILVPYAKPENLVVKVGQLEARAKGKLFVKLGIELILVAT